MLQRFSNLFLYFGIELPKKVTNELSKTQVCLKRSKCPFTRSERSHFGLFTHFDIFLPFIQK